MEDTPQFLVWGFKNVHLVGDGDSGLVAKLCPTLGTPWTVACQAPQNEEPDGL